MAFREVRVFEVREVLRLSLSDHGFRGVERLSGVDRKTVRRYVTTAVEAGLDRPVGRTSSPTSSWRWWWRRSDQPGGCWSSTRNRSRPGSIEDLTQKQGPQLVGLHHPSHTELGGQGALPDSRRFAGAHVVVLDSQGNLPQEVLGVGQLRDPQHG